MQAPTAIEALAVWERGQARGPAQRGLDLLALAHPEMAVEALADLSIGARNGALLALYEAMFGSRIEGCADCPACAEPMETSFAVADLLSSSRGDGLPQLCIGDYRVFLRLLTSRDLIAAAEAKPEDRRGALFARCVVSANVGGEEVPATALPAEIVQAAARSLSGADPQADIQLSLSCAACGHRWAAPFDILRFLWTKLDAWAKRQLREIHVLACAYGWRESEILALSPLRRSHYLELIESWPTI
jgi:hypothetical protein